ncbi:elongation factor P [Tsuneonella sp. HG249]
MIRCFPILVALFVAGPALAQGDLGTLPKGRYLCELPGDAVGLASRPVAGQWFDVVNASRYVTVGGEGTYLLTGQTVVFTRGPMRGARFEWNGMKAMQRTDLTGDLAKLRCVRSGRGPAD